MPKIFIPNLDLVLPGNPTITLLNIFIQNGAPIHTICGGRSNCGCCRIKVLEGQKGMLKVNESEQFRLGDDLIKEGWRLSCQTYALKDITIYMPVKEDLEKFCSDPS